MFLRQLNCLLFCLVSAAPLGEESIHVVVIHISEKLGYVS